VVFLGFFLVFFWWGFGLVFGAVGVGVFWLGVFFWLMFFWRGLGCGGCFFLCGFGGGVFFLVFLGLGSAGAFRCIFSPPCGQCQMKAQIFIRSLRPSVKPLSRLLFCPRPSLPAISSSSPSTPFFHRHGLKAKSFFSSGMESISPRFIFAPPLTGDAAPLVS